MEKRHQKLLVLGLVITTVGALWLMTKLDIGLPRWLMSWKTILVALGIIISVQSNFKSTGGWVLLGIGSYFLLDDLGWMDSSIRNYFFPVFAIAVGIFLIVKYFRSRDDGTHLDFQPASGPSDLNEIHSFSQSRISVESVLNSHKSRITSGRFEGGSTTTVLASTELNFLECPTKGTIRLKNTVLLGSLKLIIPPNWEVQSQYSSVLSQTNDKRHTLLKVIPDCTLILAGEVILGSIDIVGG